MPDLTYDFDFTSLAGGLTVTVTDRDGDPVEIDDPVLPAAPTNADPLTAVRLQVALDEDAAPYTGQVTSSKFGTLRTAGVVNLGVSIDAGGNGGGASETVSRGILYLRASGTNIDVSAEEWGGSGELLPYELDTDRATEVPDWVTVVGDTFHLPERGNYLTQIAAKGVLSFPDAPEDIQFDIVDGNTSVLNTFINLGWYSDGSDDSEAFTPAEVNELEFLRKDGWNQVIPDGGTTFPVVLTGLRGDNYSTPSTTGAVLESVDIRVAITKIGAGPRYTEADFA